MRSPSRPRRTCMADRSLARKVLETEAAAILTLVGRLDERFDRAVQLLRQCKGRVILTGDVVVALSYSGETGELLGVLETIRRLGAKLIAMTGRPASTLAQAAD